MFVAWDIQVLATGIEKDDGDGLINFGKLFGDVGDVQKSECAVLSLVVRNDQARVSVVHATVALQEDKVHVVKAQLVS